MDPDSSNDTERAPRLSTQRPLRADAARNRTKVLEAAKEAFAAEGLAVPLDQIARRAGVGAGTVYRHFPTKEALFEAVILDRVRKLVDQAEELAQSDDPGAAFFGFLESVISGATHNRDMVDALAATNLDTAGLIIEAKRDLHRAGGALLSRAQKAGAVRKDIGATELMTLLTSTTMALRQQGGDRGLVYAVLRDGLRAR